MNAMTETKTNIFKGLSLIDETFDAKQLPNYRLLLQLGLDGLCCCVLDSARNKFVAFENYTFQEIYDYESLCDNLQSFIKDDNLFSRCVRIKNVELIWVNGKSTFIPNALFDEGNKENYLKFNHTLEKDEAVAIDTLKIIDARNLYTLPSCVDKTLKSIFKTISIHHYSSSLVESLLGRNKNEKGKKIFVHVQVDHLEVIVSEGKNLIFYNTFKYQSSEDFIYYVLFVAEQLKLNPEDMELILMGEVEKDSAIYLMLYKYVRNIKFGERPDGFEYSYKFDSLPKHFYYNLFSQSILANN